MRIVDVQHAVPSRIVTNDEVLAALRGANTERFSSTELATLERRVRHYFDLAGTCRRHVLADGERAIDVGLTATRAALAAAGDPRSIDFVIFAGIARGWLDPATAHVFAHELGIPNASCFDVLDGCASWLRGLEVAHALLCTDRYRLGLVLNCESGFEPYACFPLRSANDLEHRFAMMTIGEAATATVVARDAEDDFFFAFSSASEHHGLATLALPTMPSFVTTPVDPRCEALKFFALSRQLIATAASEVVALFEATPELRQRRVDLCVTHAASEHGTRWVLKRLGIPIERRVITHPHFGNTVAASIPLALSLALREGRLHRGDGVLAIAASAGITVGYGAFTF